MATWVCYHVIGDTLRGAARAWRRVLASASRARLAAEPTVLAPAARSAGAPAVAAPGPPRRRWRRSRSSAGSRSRRSTRSRRRSPRRARRPRCAPRRSTPQPRPADYLLAHQEYSPTTQIQGVGPYLRAVDGDRRRSRALTRHAGRRVTCATRVRSARGACRRPARGRRSRVALARACSRAPRSRRRRAAEDAAAWLDARGAGRAAAQLRRHDRLPARRSRRDVPPRAPATTAAASSRSSSTSTARRAR